MAMGLSAETAEGTYLTKVQLVAFHLIDSTAWSLAWHSRPRSRRSRSSILAVGSSPSPRSARLAEALPCAHRRRT
jgi:hypothetical protein